MDLPTERARALHVQPIAVLIFGLVVQFASLYPIWSHRSTGDVVLGGYSTRYIFVLVVYVLLTLGWVAAFVFRNRLLITLNTLIKPRRAAVACVAAVFTAGVVFVIPIELFVQQYLALNLVAFATLCITFLPQRQATSRRPYLLLVAACAIMLILALLTALSTFPFSPDEAHWLDYALSSTRHGGVYSHAWLMEPVTIKPGIGWSVALYGLAQEATGVQMETGRLWNFAFYAAAIIVSGFLSARLYGRRAGMFSALFAALSFAFFPVFDYRPDHQMPLATALITLTALLARTARSRRAAFSWHFLTGAGATLSLQFHAVGIALAFGFTLCTAFETMNAVRQQRLAEQLPGTAAFVLGAALGTLIYFFANVMPVGGLEPFLNDLVAERAYRLRWFAYLTWPSLLEGVLILAGFAYIMLRRSPSDRFVLGITACILIGLTLFDTQGYFTPVSALYVLPIGTLIVSGFRLHDVQSNASSLREMYAGAVLIMILIGQYITFINWQRIGDWMLGSQDPEYVYAAIRPDLLQRVSDDDIIVSSHFLLWTLPDHEQLYSAAGEITAMRRWQITGEQVWERVNPSVIITIEDMMEIPPGLASYMQSYEKCDTVQMESLTLNFYRPVCQREQPT